MSFYQGRKLLPQRFRLVLLSVMQTTGLPFSDVLTEEEIEDAFDEQESWFAQEEDEVFFGKHVREGRVRVACK